ncbi:MAG: hypothetical protein MI975_24070 [Cytophagales bacterium]|nr:hypothetical protein [Cytophagales bacterium]
MRLHRMRHIAFFIFFFVVSHDQLKSQVISSAELKMMTILNAGSNLITGDLQNTKTIIVVSISNDGKLRGDWKTLAEEAHFYIKKLNIDAVLYFYIDDLIAGYDVRRAISDQLIKRNIKNIFMLSRDKINGRDQYIGVLTPFNQKPDFISNNQEAWKSQTSDLEILFRNLARAIDNADLTIENLLIIDHPEYYHGSDIIRGRRFESYNTDLRIDRIAIPKFTDLPVPDNSERPSNSKMQAIINDENKNNLQKNAILERIMSAYPYKFEIVPYQYDEKKLLTRGFQFVLMSVASSGKNVRKLLGYKTSDNEKELVAINANSNSSTEKTISMDATVYKYYVKHINSGDIYLGVQWDADSNWQEAMKNHISAIIKKLGEKQ